MSLLLSYLHEFLNVEVTLLKMKIVFRNNFHQQSNYKYKVEVLLLMLDLQVDKNLTMLDLEMESQVKKENQMG